MAEIPVEKKSSRTWLWLLLAAILVVLLIWWLSSGNDNVVDEDAVATAPAGTLDTVDQSAMDPAGPMTLAAILAQPQAYIGQTFTGEVGVREQTRGYFQDIITDPPHKFIIKGGVNIAREHILNL